MASSELSGPDLAKGIAENELTDGAMLVGHAGGDPVLIARRGHEIFAVGATCTHYGAPLSEGLFDGTTVRCPWHHSCFDLRTGAAIRAPALNDIACSDVERTAERIRVRAKKESVRPASVTGSDPKLHPESVAIIGAGAAGNAAGDMDDGDCALRYFLRGKLLAIATMGRDLENLQTERAMEEATHQG